MKKSIVWLASYPKSGNTWARIFLANYLFNTKSPLNINDAHRLGTGDTLLKAYRKVLGANIPVGDFAAMMPYRMRFFEALVSNKADVNFVKTHFLNDVAFGTPLIPEEFTKAAIYILRNPLDVVVSYAKHFDKTVDYTVEAFGHTTHMSPGDNTNAGQIFGTWSQHVTSWTRKRSYPLLILQYEKMLSDPHDEFGKLIKFIGLDVDEERLDRAVRFSSFDEVSKQEKEMGFIEKPKDRDHQFFGRGESGHGAKELAPELVKKIRTDHKAVMKKYGYW